MKLTIEELKKLADTINVDVTDEEIMQIQNSIVDITSRIDEMLQVADDCEPFISPCEQTNVFNGEFEKTDSNIMEKLNGYDGEYIKTEKVVDDE